MNAIEVLTHQHREVEDMFEEFEEMGEKTEQRRERLCARISDALAMHSEIEEKIFYPATKDARTEDALREAVEEHLSVKRLVADLIDTPAKDPQFDAKMKVLKEQVEHHVNEEENDLFPQVRKLLSSEELDRLGGEMEALAEKIEEEGDARMQVPGETGKPAPI